jgi:DNA-binding MarR family transcriptional regulator
MSASAKVRQIGRECIAVRVRLLNRLVTQECDEGLRPFGVRVALVNVLVAVAVSGPVTPTVLARRLVMDKSTLSRDVEKMLEKGWLETVPSEDGRSHTLRATEAGLAFLEEIHPAWAAAQKRLADRLGTELLSSLGGAVNAIWAEMG